jgi:hypothetical protein
VSYSQKPENYIPEEHLNPIDVFEYWSKVMWDTYLDTIQDLYHYLGYTPNQPSVQTTPLHHHDRLDFHSVRDSLDGDSWPQRRRRTHQYSSMLQDRAPLRQIDRRYRMDVQRHNRRNGDIPPLGSIVQDVPVKYHHETGVCLSVSVGLILCLCLRKPTCCP